MTIRKVWSLTMTLVLTFIITSGCAPVLRKVATFHHVPRKIFGTVPMKTFPNLWLSTFLKFTMFTKIRRIRPLYYIDYRNARPKFIEAWWNLVNWSFANKNFG